MLTDPDPVETGKRCHSLGIDRVAVRCQGLPGFDDRSFTGAPNPAYLKDLADRLREQKLRVSCLVKLNAFGLDPDIVRNPSNHRREIDEMLETIDAAAGAGIDTILHYVNPKLPEDPAEDDELWGGMIQVFRELVAQAESSGVRLANHGLWACLPDGIREQALAQGVTYAEDYRRFRDPGWMGPFLVHTVEDIARIVEDEVPSPNNGVCLCTGMHINGANPPGWVERFRDKIFFAQMRDHTGRWPVSREAFTGEGDVGLQNVLRLLYETGYTGTVHPEHLGHPRFDGDDLEAAAVTRVKSWVDELTGGGQ